MGKLKRAQNEPDPKDPLGSVLSQFPTAELGEGEGAVRAAKLLEWNEFPVQEPGEIVL